MPITVKHGKLYMKDSSGTLVQIIPESSASIPDYQGATSSASGVSGLVPAAQSNQKEKFLRGDGTWQEVVTDAPSTYQGATSSASGTAGLVPAATAAQKDNYLKGDGTWGSISLPSTYVGATSGASGTAGLVPAATSAERDSYLKGDGTWGTIALPAAYQGATSNADGVAGLVPAATSANRDKFLKADGTWAEVSTAKEVASMTSEPTAQNTTALDNGSLIFYDIGSSATAVQPVFTTGNQTVQGVKTFTAGVFGGKQTITGSSFDCSAATCFTKTLTTNTTFSFTNVPEDAVCCITVILVNGGNYTVTWPSSVKWTKNLPPDLTENGTDVVTFITATGGNVWYGTATCLGVTA